MPLRWEPTWVDDKGMDQCGWSGGLQVARVMPADEHRMRGQFKWTHHSVFFQSPPAQRSGFRASIEEAREAADEVFHQWLSEAALKQAPASEK